LGKEAGLLCSIRRRQRPRSLSQEFADPPQTVRRLQAGQTLEESKNQIPDGIRGLFQRLAETLLSRGRA